MEIKFDESTPKALGYSFPAEWAKHEATWLSWPHKEESWPGKIETIYEPYCQFIKIVATGEKVRINVRDEKMKASAIGHLEKAGADLHKLSFTLTRVMMHGAGIMVRLS